MKKSILIVCAVLTTFSLTAFGYMNRNNTATDQKETPNCKTVAFDNDLSSTTNTQADFDFFYKVDSRFGPVTKETVHNAKSIHDIFQVKEPHLIESYQLVKVSFISKDNVNRDAGEIGNSHILNATQLKLLHSFDCSTTFLISGSYTRKNADTGVLEKDTLICWRTIVPEKEAEFEGGIDALLEYLKENSKESTANVEKDKIQPDKVRFTITKEGTIANVKLTCTSGYPAIDQKMIELINTMPGKWNPATNSIGEKVAQELLFCFGTIGC